MKQGWKVKSLVTERPVWGLLQWQEWWVTELRLWQWIIEMKVLLWPAPLSSISKTPQFFALSSSFLTLIAPLLSLDLGHKSADNCPIWLLSIVLCHQWRTGAEVENG